MSKLTVPLVKCEIKISSLAGTLNTVRRSEYISVSSVVGLPSASLVNLSIKSESFTLSKLIVPLVKCETKISSPAGTLNTVRRSEYISVSSVVGLPSASLTNLSIKVESLIVSKLIVPLVKCETKISSPAGTLNTERRSEYISVSSVVGLPSASLTNLSIKVESFKESKSRPLVKCLTVISSPSGTDRIERSIA